MAGLDTPQSSVGGMAWSPLPCRLRERVRVRVLLPCLALFASCALAAPTFHAGPTAAREAAAADQSLVMLVFLAKWSNLSQELEREALKSAEFTEKGGVLRVVLIDVDEDEKTAKTFDVTSVPTLILISADDKIIARRKGPADAAALNAWVEEGRQRAKAGQWEGIAPSGRLEEFASKAAADRLETNDLNRLVLLLGQSDPAERAGVTKILLGQREAAMPYLLTALAHDYLGIRIGAAEVLQKLAGEETRKVVGDDLVAIAWAGREESRTKAALLRKWWDETGKLPAAAVIEKPVVDATTEGSIRRALEQLRSKDPVARTEAMSALVTHGTAALPAVREALKKSAGDPRTASLLEDVRWAILVPDALELRAGKVRTTLARGNSTERQAAAVRLGKAGKTAIPALAELAEDADALVVENAVRALSSVGGKDAVPAMSALLRAGDSNLRMTAAQALGHTKSQDALPALVAAFDDPNEIVACAALAGAEEVCSASRSYSDETPVPADLVAGLKKAVGDPRWRVRASAAEVAGKVRAKETVPELKKLLEDTDGFVVKQALQSLQALGGAPEAAQLAKLAQRLTTLRGDAVEMMVRSQSDETVKVVTQLFDASGPSERAAILNAFGRKRGRGDVADMLEQWRETQKRSSGSGEGEEAKANEDPWKPLLARAVKEAEPAVRRAAAAALASRPPPTMVELVGTLLSDTDRDAQDTAAGLVIALTPTEAETKTNKMLATPAMVSGWHETLRKQLGGKPSVNVAMAAYVTGDGVRELPALTAALGGLDEKTVRQLLETPAVPALLKKLPWPAGKATLENICGVPALYAEALSVAGRRSGPVTEFLMEPARFQRMLERTTKMEQSTLVDVLINDERKKWSLGDSTPGTAALREALLASSNGLWRAAAVYTMCRGPAEKSAPVATTALGDKDPWVRAAAVQSLARLVAEQAVLESKLGPLLSDNDARVAGLAAWALLDPNVRNAAQMTYGYTQFRYGNASANFYESSSTSDERPLTTIEPAPSFLPEVRKQLTGTNTFQLAASALLLAQYGDFSGVDKMIAQPAAADEERHESLPAAVLTGIELSRDAKYLPYLRRLVGTNKNEYDLRRLLRALRGMSGPDARALRMEINKKMRKSAD